MPRQHHMVLTESDTADAEEWLCHECGRRVAMRWPPRFEMVVLSPGDENAVHSAAKGARLDGAEVTLGPEELPADTRRWLWDNGIDWDGLAS